MDSATIQLDLQKGYQKGDLQKTTDKNIQSQDSIFNNASIDESKNDINESQDSIFNNASIDESKNDINESEKSNELASEDLSLIKEIHNALNEHSEEIAANIERE